MVRAFADQTMRRVYWRLIPLLFVMMFFSQLDRINVGFAVHRMNDDIGLSARSVGFGAGMFLFGYLTLAIPSNLMMHRFGARRWLGCILIGWGAAAAAMALAWNATSFYGLRLLLGATEAGLLPGIASYLTAWFPERYRARAVGGYIFAGAFSALLGGPISASLVTGGEGLFDLRGWQWMFVVEGVPPMILGGFVLRCLTERPRDARWLSKAQRDWLEQTLLEERTAIAQRGRRLLREVIGDKRAWSVAALFGCALVGIDGLLMRLPSIVTSLGELSDVEIGLLSALPPSLGMVGAIAVSYSSDRLGDRKKHLAVIYALSAAGLVGIACASSPLFTFIMLCVAGASIYASNPLFWSLAASLKSGVAGAATIAFIYTVAQLGGSFGAWLLTALPDRTESFAMVPLAIAGFLVAAVMIALAMQVSVHTASIAGPDQKSVPRTDRLRPE